jgi:hypothetical protein
MENYDEFLSSEEESFGANHETAETHDGTAGSRSVVPYWEPETRRLWVGDCLLHHYKRPAPNQELLLTTFQEENWLLEWTDDPIPPASNVDSRKRLANAVHGLNHCQCPRMLYFSLLNDGTAVAWKWLALPSNQQTLTDRSTIPV